MSLAILEVLAMMVIVCVAFVGAEVKFRRLPEAKRSPKIILVRGVMACFLAITVAVAIFICRVEAKRRSAEDQMAKLEADAKARL